jgi:hypothetical protein
MHSSLDSTKSLGTDPNLTVYLYRPSSLPQSPKIACGLGTPWEPGIQFFFLNDFASWRHKPYVVQY